VKLSVAVVLVVALLVPCTGQAAQGMSFLDLVNSNQAEELSYSVPANFPGPLVAQPRRTPEPRAMLLACLGLIVYLGRRRAKALAL
jgi:hypothetical protein